MDRVFRVDFYPHEWLTMTSHMNPEQRGVFIQVCALIYANRGPVKNDPQHFGRISNCSARLARSIIEQLTQTGDLVVRGKFVSQKRCESELNKKRTHLELSSKGGRNKAENGRESSKNNNLTSTDHRISLRSSSLPFPSPVVVSGKKEPDTTPPLPPKGGVPLELEKFVMDDGVILDFDGFFERMWLLYPALRDKGHKGKAKDQMKIKLKGKISHETISRGVAKFRAYCEATEERNPDMFRWLRDHGFDRPYEIPSRGSKQINGGGAGKETDREQRRRALAEAAAEMGLIEPGDVAAP